MSSAELMEQKAPAAKPMAPPPDFPVQWEHPSDAGHFWMLDRMHTPDPITPLDQTFLEQVYAGMSAGAERYDLPSRMMCRRINTYLYWAVVPVVGLPAEMEAQ